MSMPKPKQTNKESIKAKKQNVSDKENIADGFPIVQIVHLNPDFSAIEAQKPKLHENELKQTISEPPSLSMTQHLPHLF